MTQEQLHRKADDISHSQLVKSTNSLAMEQLQNNPLSNVFGLNQTVIDTHRQIVTGQGHHYSGQGHMQHVLLQPPPQYGVHQSNMERQWNQSQLNFPINVNQTNYLLTGDHQVLPVIPVFKQGHEGQVIPSSNPVTQIPGENNNQTRSVQMSFSQNETVQTIDQHDTGINSFGTSQSARGKTNNSAVNDFNSLLNPIQSPALRQYQIVSDQGVQLLNIPSSVIEQSIGQKAINVQQTQTSDKPEVFVSTSVASVDQSENINPNIYFHLVPDSPEKSRQFSAEKVTSRHMPKPSVSIQNGGFEFIDKPASNIDQISECKISNDTRDHETKKQSENATQRSNVHNLNVKDLLIDQSMSENSSTMIPDSVSNQSGPALELANQTQLIVPVSFFPSSSSSGVGSEQIPSQIQISFQTCSTENDQLSFTQQIILPHGNVVTLPLIPMSSSKDVDMPMPASISTFSSKENMTQVNNVSHDGVPEHIKSHQRENLPQDCIEQRAKIVTVDKHIITESNPSKSRNCSGNSRKSRNSSDSSDKSKRSVVHFSDTSKLESHQEHGHANLRPETLTDFHFVTKINKSRHRQYSGNSEHGDRSRKSSGNSVFSETSSHTSGLTLSNLASPNIFLDKEKGIFFIQSMDGLDEIDNAQLVDLIQAVEADQTIGTEKHGKTSANERNVDEFVEQNKSDKSDNENIDFSRNTVIGKPKKIKHVNMEDILIESVEPHVSGFDSQNIDLLRHGVTYSNNDAKLSEESSDKTNRLEETHKELDTVVVDEHSERKNGKRKEKQNNKKALTGSKNHSHVRKHKNMPSDIFISNAILSKDGSQHLGNGPTTNSFVPIAPKISQKMWNVEINDQKEHNSRLSHNAPVLSSLLSRKPMF
jgi:hypothetical protein